MGNVEIGLTIQQGGRSLSAKAKMTITFFVKNVFTIFATNQAKSTQYNVQLYHVIVHFLPNKHCFGPKMALFLPKISKKCINRDKSQYRDRMATACVQVQTFWRRPFVPSHNFYHPAIQFGFAAAFSWDFEEQPVLP